MPRRTTLLLALVCGVAVSSVYAAQPVLEEMSGDLGLTPDASGWLVATGQLGYLVGLVALVPLGDLLDRRRLIAGQLVGVAGALAAVAVAPSVWMALPALALAGVAAVVVQTTVAYAASSASPDERGRVIGTVTSGVVVGILGARILSGILADVGGWRLVYAAIAALSVALAAAVALALSPDPPRATSRYRDVIRSLTLLASNPLFLSRGVIAFFVFASFGTLWSGMSLPLSDAPWRLSEGQIGLFGIAGLAGAIGAARAGRWGDRGRADRVIGIAAGVLLLSWAAIAQLPWSLVLLGVGIVLLDFAVQAVHVSNQHILTTAFPALRSTTIGGYMVFYSLGSAVGAAATTAVSARSGWGASALLGAAFALGAIATWLAGRRVVARALSAATPGGTAR